jgi:hypothetical protein
MIRMKANPAATVRVRKTAKELICADLGTTYRALSAEASTASGLSPSLGDCVAILPLYSIVDELRSGFAGVRRLSRGTSDLQCILPPFAASAGATLTLLPALSRAAVARESQDSLYAVVDIRLTSA